MSETSIAFRSEFRDRILSGRKTATSRVRAYGEAGDTFRVFDATFELTRVYWELLEVVRDTLYREEGFERPEEFVEIWREIHPTRGFVGGDCVWVLRFRRTDETGQGRVPASYLEDPGGTFRAPLL